MLVLKAQQKNTNLPYKNKKMMLIDDLKNKVEEINTLIKEKIFSENPDELEPIYDGIIDIERYFDSKYKILWILKEPYDEDGGGWSVTGLNKYKKFQDFGGGKKTFRPMIYTSWGILNNFCQWDNMGNVEEEPEMLEALKSVAYINIKKLPGDTKSIESTIANAYQKDKEILLKQIKDYNPDIIIGGSTLHHFYDDLGISKEEMQRNGNITFLNNKIYIAAKHPSQWSVPEKEYCDNIINAVKKLVTNKM
jgi:hypothetical protein